MVEPREGNYELSQRGNKAIRHILDRVLSDPAPNDDSLAAEMLDENLLNGCDLDDGTQFLQWLDNTVDCRQESWVNWLTFS